jgi:hypothetical protein
MRRLEWCVMLGAWSEGFVDFDKVSGLSMTYTDTSELVYLVVDGVKITVFESPISEDICDNDASGKERDWVYCCFKSILTGNKDSIDEDDVFVKVVQG